MNILVLKISIYVIIAICRIKENQLIVSKAPRMAFICQIRAFMAVAQWRQMRQMPRFWNGKCNLLKANKIFFFLQNLSKFTPFASLYSDPAYGRGITMFAANIRDTIDEVLNLPKRYTSPRRQTRRPSQSYYNNYNHYYARGGYYRGRGRDRGN
jgi:hypothetical protein